MKEIIIIFIVVIFSFVPAFVWQKGQIKIKQLFEYVCRVAIVSSNNLNEKRKDFNRVEPKNNISSINFFSQYTENSTFVKTQKFWFDYEKCKWNAK